MKAIRIELYQPSASYRVKNSYVLRHSYPLPPFSSVIGMIHAACSFTEYHPMRIAIEGTNASTHSDLSTAYFFGGVKFDSGRHQMKVRNLKKEGEYIGITQGTAQTQILTDVNLRIYICPEHEEDFLTIYEHLRHPDVYLSLGRYEDIVQIKSVDITELIPIDKDENEYGFYGFTYIPVNNIESTILGTMYDINKKFSYDKSKKRIWDEVIKCIYSNDCSDLKNLLCDTEKENLVILA